MSVPRRPFSSIALAALFAASFGVALRAQLPHATPDGYALPNGWKISPAGRSVNTEDMVLKLITSPDDRVVIASHSGYNPHGLVVADETSEESLQRIPLKTTWLGM